MPEGRDRTMHWTIGCLTPGLHCQEYPVYSSSETRAARLAKQHQDETGHGSIVRRVTTVVELRIEPTDDASPQTATP